jgi:hypothetical protein
MGCVEHEGQNRGLNDNHDCKAADRQCMPEPGADRVAEGAIDHEQDRAPIGRGKNGFVPEDEVADPGTQQLARHQRRDQKKSDLADRVAGRRAAPR